MKRLGLYYQKSFLGEIGTDLGVQISRDVHGSLEPVDLKVGDVIAFRKYGRIYVKVVICREGGQGGVFGFGSKGLDFSDMIKILDYTDLTEDMFQKTQEENSGSSSKFFTIKELKEIEMTVSEIENELGYSIKVVSSYRE